jgi:hypothetical protein
LQAAPVSLQSSSAKYGELTQMFDARMHAKQGTTRKNFGVAPPWLSKKLRNRRAFVVS